jgi:hypothetical protein
MMVFGADDSDGFSRSIREDLGWDEQSFRRK